MNPPPHNTTHSHNAMVFDMPRANGRPLSSPRANHRQSSPQHASPRRTGAPQSPSLTPQPHLHTHGADFHAQAEAAVLAETRRATFGSGLHSAGIQIKDQERSKWFYTNVLGMEVVKETESGSATMIWLAFPNPADAETEDLEFGQRRGMLQLVHVNGSETQKNFRVVHGVPGFCHFCINVIDLEESMARYKLLGVNIVEEGDNEQGWGVISDPDGYTIQLLYCKIDQSLALKRQVEEMMSIASSSKSAVHRSPSRERTQSLARSTTNNSSIHSGLPGLSSFRGGSPDFEHPHWQVGGADGDPNRLVPTTSTTDASDDGDEGEFVPGPRSRRPSHARGDEWPPSSIALVASSSASSQLSSGKTPRAREDRGRSASGNGPPSYSASAKRSGSLSAPLSSQASNMTRSRSGSIYRPNAPRSIDLTALQLEAQQRFTPDGVAEAVDDVTTVDGRMRTPPVSGSASVPRSTSSPAAMGGNKKKKGANAPSAARPDNLPLSALTAPSASLKPKAKALKSFRDRFSFGGSGSGSGSG